MRYIRKNELQKINDRYAEYVCNKATARVKEKLDEFIKFYYREYTPEQYTRTWAFFNSVLKTEAEKAGPKWMAKVYIDTSIQYPSMINGRHWNMADTASFANQGLHGDVRVGDSSFFDDAYSEILDDKHLTSNLISFMKQHGIHVEYKKL